MELRLSVIIYPKGMNTGKDKFHDTAESEELMRSILRS